MAAYHGNIITLNVYTENNQPITGITDIKLTNHRGLQLETCADAERMETSSNRFQHSIWGVKQIACSHQQQKNADYLPWIIPASYTYVTWLRQRQAGFR